MSDMMDWGTVGKGFVVEDKTGVHWTVTDRQSRGVVTISAPGKKPWTGNMTGQVKVVSRPAPLAPQEDPAIDEVVAKGLLAVKFGAVEIGKQGRDKTQPWKTPVEFDEPGSLLAHLRIFHAAMSDDPTLAGLSRFHADLHGPEHKTADQYEPHVHDPDYESL